MSIKQTILDKLIYSLLLTLLLFAISQPITAAKVFSKSKNKITGFFKRVVIVGNEYTALRGEIWYGDASWYGSGRKTSNGEKFNKNELTAAHKTLPFNTKVRVTNLKNNKSVIVRINDRGPFYADRIIDLSEKAAEKIDAKRQGIAYVKVQVIGSY